MNSTMHVVSLSRRRTYLSSRFIQYIYFSLMWRAKINFSHLLYMVIQLYIVDCSILLC